jgi:glycosyltransferase involved in cell wall biosynthesis
LFQGIKESRKIFWIPDFQEEYFPYLFDEVSLKKRRKMRTFFAKQNKNIVVFSSENALMDFRNFYGPEINAKTKVLQFANPDHWKFESLFIEQTLQKYNLVSNGYFICPNQIWEHKNHQIVLDAVRMCSQKNSKLKVVFCGKEYDPRNPNYVTDLKLKGKDLVDSGHIQFLGFLPKDEQMCLIKESIALIQPSKFEGWSTTIEDGIVFGKQIIASNLLVNQEQLKDNGIYFDPVNTDELSKILLNYCNTNSYVDYNQRKRVEEFAFKLVGLLD